MVVNMVNKEKKENILYETIANELDKSLPRTWQLNNIGYFSNNKKLFDY